MRHSIVVPLLLAVVLVALPACDGSDEAGLNAPSPNESTSATATTFSSDRLSNTDLAIDGVVETTGDRSGRIEIHTQSRMNEKGAPRASRSALAGLPSEIQFDGNTITYTRSTGETRTVELSDRDAAMLADALDARRAAQQETPDDFEFAAPKSGTTPSGDDVLDALRQNGYTVESLGGDRYAVTPPVRHDGAVQVTSIYNAATGEMEGTTARHDGDDVVQIGVSQAKDGEASPQVQILDED